MFQLILAILLGLACPSHTPTNTNNSGTVTTYGAPDPDPDTGGDTGHIPPKKP